MEAKELEFTISDATVYDAVSRIESHGTFASRANQVLEGVNISTEQLGDLVSNTAELLDKVKAFTDLVDNIASVSIVCHWVQTYRSLGLQLHPYAQCAWGVLSSVYKARMIRSFVRPLSNKS